MLLTAKRQPLPSKPQMADRTLDEIGELIDSGDYVWSGGGMSTAGAIRQSTVWSCVRILAEIIAQLPIEVKRRQNGGWVTAESHNISRLLAAPNSWQTQHDVISHLVTWFELVGNGCLFKVQDLRGVTQMVYPLETGEVTADMLYNHRLQYTVSSQHGISGVYGPDKVMHFRNFGLNGYWGLSTIGCHREGIGLARQLEDHASGAYRNGLQARHWIELEEELGEEEKEEFKIEVNKKLAGTKNAGQTPVFHAAKIHALNSMSAVDAQYIESRKLQKQEIAGLFGVPLFLLNDTEKSTTWGTGLEQLSRSFVRFSLNPRLNRLGQTLVREFVPPRDRMSTKVVFDTDSFTLGEFKERMDGYRSGIEAGVLNPNEAREVEGRNPREGGDEYRKPMNIGIEGDDNDATNNAG